MLACAVLTLALGLQAVVRYDDEPPAGGLAPRHTRPVTIPSVPEYPAILSVPIFTPDRRPGVVEAGLPSTVEALDGYAVLGAAVGGSVATALISSPGGAPRTLRPGETLEGWSVVSVERTKVTFERNGARHSLIVGAPAESVTRSASGAIAGTTENQ